MKLHIPKIKLETLTVKQLEVYFSLNQENFGRDLATKVTEKLMQTETNNGLYHSHRDYCGLGLFYVQNRFYLASIDDGYYLSFNFEKRERDFVASFESKDEFIEWLSQENNQSMALYGEKFDNQTITKVRLLWFLEENYDPVWNSYCRFLSDNNLQY